MGQKTTKKTTTKSASRQKKIIKWLIIAVAAAVAVFGVYEVGRHGGYWGEPDTLRMIKKEKLASKNLLGMELLSSEQDGEGHLVVKTVTPSVTREFKAANGNVDETIESIVTYAEQDGWAYDPSTYATQDDRWIWRKLKNDTRLVLYIEKRENSIIVRISGHEN